VIGRPAVALVQDRFRGRNPQGAATARQRHAALQVAFFAQLVQEARDRAGVAPQLAGVALEVVDLFDDEDWQDDLVVFELEDRPRVVQQHVRVEDVELSHWPRR